MSMPFSRWKRDKHVNSRELSRPLALEFDLETFKANCANTKIVLLTRVPVREKDKQIQPATPAQPTEVCIPISTWACSQMDGRWVGWMHPNFLQCDVDAIRLY